MRANPYTCLLIAKQPTPPYEMYTILYVYTGMVGRLAYLYLKGVCIMRIAVFSNRNSSQDMEKLQSYLASRQVKVTILKYRKSGKQCGIAFNTDKIALAGSILKALKGVQVTN